MAKNNKVLSWVKTILYFLCFAISVFLLFAIPYSFTNPATDPEYAVLTANDTVTTKTYPIDPCSDLRFCYAWPTNGMKRTLFLSVIPEIRIVNDESYYVELTANSSVHDAISIVVEDGILDIDFRDNYYHRVHEDDISYDYDSGLYVDCTAFSMTVHAPISKFHTDTQTKLDFDVAKADEVILSFSFEGTQADIYNIDANTLHFYCSGTSDVTLSGAVSSESSIKVWHNTRVDASKLSADFWDVFVSNQPLGISYVIHDFTVEFDLFDLGTFFTVVLVGIPILWGWLSVKSIRKFLSP